MAGSSKQMNQGAQQASQCQPGQCKSCERTGIPVLPLRYAPTPTIGAKFNRGIDAEYHDNNLRILRQGYVYVLLDKKVWQAYQVTPEGALRQFDPLQPPRGDAKTLSQACITENHDVPASFINISDGFATAQIAFANDAWPKQVLDDYRTGKSPATRFSTYTIAKFKTDPSTAGASKSDEAFGMTQTLDLTKKVWEYAPGAKDFDSVHGFYSRANRVAPTQAFVAASIKQYKLEKGMPVVLLHDAIGTVQEYNSLRNRSVIQRNLWAADPLRRYQYFTSQALIGLKDQAAKWAKQQAPTQAIDNLANKRAGSYVGARPWSKAELEAETRQAEADLTTDMKARLEKRYSEGARKEFQDKFDRQMTEFQKQIDRFGERWAQWCESPKWIHTCEHDYNGDDVTSMSGCAYTGMMSVCVAGGPTEVPEQRKAGGELPPLKGATRILWNKWLNDKNSPPYQALLAKNSYFLAGLLPSFDNSKQLSLNDSSKLWEAFKSTLTSVDVGEKFMQNPFKESMAALLTAVNSAATGMEARLEPSVQRAVRHLNMGSAKLCLDRAVTCYTVQLTVGEYFMLLSEQLHESMKNAGKSVRALILGGLVSLPDPAVRSRLVDVTLWSLESAENIKKQLTQARSAAVHGINDTLGRIVKGVETLEPGAIAAIKKLEIGSQPALKVTKNVMKDLATGVGGKELLLAAISLYCAYQGQKSSIATLQTTVGSTHAETLVGAASASLGFIGATTEAVGVAVKFASKQVRIAARASRNAGTVAAARYAVKVGEQVVRVSGVMIAATYLVDAAQDTLMAVRASKQGDGTALRNYATAAALSLVAGYAGITGAMAAEATLLGPLGLAVVLGLAAYSLVQLAKGEESTPAEMWARRSYFGDHKCESVSWIKPEQADEAIAALNAVLLGVSVDMDFSTDLRAAPSITTTLDTAGLVAGTTLNYRIVLPSYDPVVSGFAFALSVTRHHGGTQVLVARQERVPALAATQNATKGQLDYDTSTLEAAISKSDKAKGVPKVIDGAISLNTVAEGGSDIVMASLHVKYVPDVVDSYGFAELTVQETV